MLRSSIAAAAIALLVPFACSSSSSTGATPGADAGDEDADDGGCHPASTTLPACSWDKTPYLDAGFSEDRAARTFLTCTSASGVNGGCLGVDLERCAPGEDPAQISGPGSCCTSTCAPNEYAVGGPSNATNAPSGCRAAPVVNGPGGPSGVQFVLFCCPCQ